ncbi:perlucin-like [Mya arenaria]|uniref:perlucin-like n=1 Tax=Mya arenaria TaxID=6604 RepID=UPI0022E500B9|nr:perlucin-like [Mya arenaria]
MKALDICNTLMIFGLISTVASCFETRAQEPNCEGLCPDGWVYFRCSCYLFMDIMKASWTEAEHHCETHKATLVIIETNAENLFVIDFARRLYKTDRRPTNSFWIGATDTVTEGLWTWYTDDSPLNFTGWAPTEPDNKVDQDCVLLGGPYNYLWDDDHCSLTASFICEKGLSYLSGPDLIG